MQDCNVNILGTDYRVIFKNREEDKKLEKISGYMDPSIKEIVVCTMKDEMEDEMAVENMESIRRSTFRHEIPRIPIRKWTVERQRNSRSVGNK